MRFGPTRAQVVRWWLLQHLPTRLKGSWENARNDDGIRFGRYRESLVERLLWLRARRHYEMPTTTGFTVDDDDGEP